MAALSCMSLTRVVARAFPLKLTTELLTKPVPFTVKVKAGPPASALGGENELIVGWGGGGGGGGGGGAEPPPQPARHTLKHKATSAIEMWSVRSVMSHLLVQCGDFGPVPPSRSIPRTSHVGPIYLPL